MIQLVKKLFNNAAIILTDRQADLFSRYYRLINENNDDNDLTRIKGEENFIIRHFIDSVYYTKFIKLPGSLVDIGTGAGFPGIPLKIMFPELKLILAEQRSRRMEFLKLAVKSLGLEHVDFYPHKVTDKSFFDVDGVITRALEDAPETLTRVHHFLPENGVIILLKGPDADGDIHSLSDDNKRYFNLETDKEYTLPGTDFKRRILLFRKSDSGLKRIYKILKDENETCGIPVTSEDNKTFKEIKRAAAGDLIKKQGLVAISGKKIISDFLDSTGAVNSRLVLPDEYIETDESFMQIIEKFRENNSLYIFRKGLFNEIDAAAGKSPVLVAEAPQAGEWDGSLVSGCNPVIPFQDPLNVGAAVRSCAGFGIERIILTRDAANPYHPKSIRASSGAVFKMEFVKGPSLEEFSGIIDNSVPVISLDRGGDDLAGISFPGSFLLIPGIEGPGLPANLKMHSVSIPVSDAIESLNAPAALAIFMYVWRGKTKK
ncbi:MAG TPA: 16S rRNA (guanine(527)-N(7))-methyltransferase RsmG [Spirochaetota bacterium]|nr:16S rRNA (guanine(527)-N(7))-methyltransferase RsmG [Spirochaetota bacterium]